MKYSFCPKCGNRLAVQLIDGHERLVCSGCGFVFYQNSKPCVGALVVDQDRLLLIKRAIAPFKGDWDIPGGFLEPDEHPETGAVREVFEETGLHIQLGELLGIFMDVYETTGDPTLNIFYTATVAGGEARAGSDAMHIQWFDLDALPQQIAFKSAHQVLGLLQNGHKQTQGRSNDGF
jgi:ADP-ribose pyrophosphatase YjhB (NUDIX family)